MLLRVTYQPAGIYWTPRQLHTPNRRTGCRNADFSLLNVRQLQGGFLFRMNADASGARAPVGMSLAKIAMPKPML